MPLVYLIRLMTAKILLEIGRIHVRLRPVPARSKTWPHQRTQPSPPTRSAKSAENCTTNATASCARHAGNLKNTVRASVLAAASARPPARIRPKASTSVVKRACLGPRASVAEKSSRRVSNLKCCVKRFGMNLRSRHFGFHPTGISGLAA